MENDHYLKQAYKLKTSSDTLNLYENWADSYEQTLAIYGYVTPKRCAEALLRHLTDITAPILDIGCGTGLSGLALKNAGFSKIDGTDVSATMLDKARLRKGVYETLQLTTLSAPFPFAKGKYAAITAMGVIADKHAPPETISKLIGKLNKGGFLVFSLNNHTLENPTYEAEIHKLKVVENACLLEAEMGPHMTSYNMTSKICVLQAL